MRLPWEFSPLLTDLPPLDELLRRHHVPRRGLVHLDCAIGFNVEPILYGVCSHALRRGEKVVLIGVPTGEPTDADASTGQAQERPCSPQDNSNEENASGSEDDPGYSEQVYAPGASMRCLGATTLRDVGTLFHILLHEPVLPDLIAIEGFERLFLPGTGSSPEKGDAATQLLSRLKSSSTGEEEADPIQASLATLRRWLEVCGGLCRDRGIPLWLRPSSKSSSAKSSSDLNSVFYRELSPLLYAHSPRHSRSP